MMNPQTNNRQHKFSIAFKQPQYLSLTFSATNANSVMHQPQKQDSDVQNVQKKVKQKVSKHNMYQVDQSHTTQSETVVVVAISAAGGPCYQ